MAIRKRKKRGDFIIVLFVVAIMLGAYNTFAKYTSSVSTAFTAKVARWQVSVNTKDITSATTLSNDLNFKIIPNQYIASNKIAPSSEGYFDINIDTTSAEVASKYTITIDSDSINAISGLSVAGYELINGTVTDATSVPATLNTVTNNTITGELLLSENKGQAITVRVFLKWENTNTSETNELQTAIGTGATSSIQVPVNVLVEQYN